VYLFYEECCKAELDFRLSRAIDLTNCLIFASPPTSKSDVSRKKTQWRKFLDSLDWEKLQEKAKPKTVEDLFKGLPVPIRIIAPKGDVKKDANDQ